LIERLAQDSRKFGLRRQSSNSLLDYCLWFITWSAHRAKTVQHITKFLLELGAGFAFVGKQVHIEVGGDDFFIDLLFYHIKLRCYVVVELKAGAFKPEHAGQLSFYLSAVDEQMKASQDAPTIGLLLCKSKNKVVAECALRDLSKPIGVAEYQLIEALPADLQSGLPSIEAIEQALAG
jgi:YhcG PDDEXK nuclease domain